jgi:fructuronate reductase
VHIGLGAFHRAHQAAYLEAWLEHNGGGNWGICATNIRSNRALVEQMNAQQCRYHIAEYADRTHVQVTEIRSIHRVLFARDDKSALLAQMAAPETKIVSLTISEKGYCLSPASGELRLDDPDIAHDLINPDNPRTAPALLLAALKRRQRTGLEPFTVLSCDNMPENGQRTRRAVMTLAAEQSTQLAAWIKAEVAFPSSMVDRIVPAVTAEKLQALELLIGYPDPAAVACEAFSQWVIEDHFPAGRPDWESVGVEMVSDVGPYETMKLRLLNGAHSLLAYDGLQSGMTTVAEAVADPQLHTRLGDYLAEASTSLEPTTGLDAESYTRALLERFRNDALEHQLHQIAMDGSQKLPQRWLEGVRINLEQGRPIRATAAAVAAWMSYVRGKDQHGASYSVDDPLAAQLADCHRQNPAPDDLVDALLAIRAVFPARLAERREFRDAVCNAYTARTA